MDSENKWPAMFTPVRWCLRTRQAIDTVTDFALLRSVLSAFAVLRGLGATTSCWSMWVLVSPRRIPRNSWVSVLRKLYMAFEAAYQLTVAAYSRAEDPKLWGAPRGHCWLSGGRKFFLWEALILNDMWAQHKIYILVGNLLGWNMNLAL
jgi:hypothetical protein